MAARKPVSSARYLGTLTDWYGKYGWVTPTVALSHPQAKKHNGKIFVAAKDLVGTPLKGTQVTFGLYLDNNGLGADNCRPQQLQPQQQQAPAAAASTAGKAAGGAKGVWKAAGAGGKAAGGSKPQPPANQPMAGKVARTATGGLAPTAKAAAGPRQPASAPAASGQKSGLQAAQRLGAAAKPAARPPAGLAGAPGKVLATKPGAKAAAQRAAATQVKGPMKTIAKKTEFKAGSKPGAAAAAASAKATGSAGDKVSATPLGRFATAAASKVKQQQQQLQQQRAGDKPRTYLKDFKVAGTVERWLGKFGWIRPSQPIKHPFATRHGGKIYAQASDLEGLTALKVGQLVKFYLYSDPSGLGADSVEAVNAPAQKTVGASSGSSSSSSSSPEGKGVSTGKGGLAQGSMGAKGAKASSIAGKAAGKGQQQVQQVGRTAVSGTGAAASSAPAGKANAGKATSGAAAAKATGGAKAAGKAGAAASGAAGKAAGACGGKAAGASAASAGSAAKGAAAKGGLAKGAAGKGSAPVAGKGAATAAKTVGKTPVQKTIKKTTLGAQKAQKPGANDGPKQPSLPPNWEEHWSDEHEIPYYWNRITKESRWIKPLK